ncbi:site-specific integrase [soil metagenome]
MTKAAIVLDTRRIKQEGTFPIKLRITFERKQKYYPTPYDLTEKEFDRVMFSRRLSDSEKELKKKITAFEIKAADIIKELPFFTWQLFEKNYLTNRGTRDSLDTAFADYIEQLRGSDRIGTAESYECAQTSLRKFAPGAKFIDVTPDFLRKYEKWMLSERNSLSKKGLPVVIKSSSITTVGIYLRSLRTLFNTLIDEGILSKELYPFGKRKYEIPTGNNVKKALALKDISNIYYYEPKEGSTTAMARDYWMFMYLCNGINVTDMCLLKYENIKGDMIEFVRAKTARTKRKIEPIRVSLVEDLREIIKKWGNSPEDATRYIFPVLSKGLSAERERQLIKQLTRTINDHMKTVAKDLKLEKNTNSYAARHSFSTILQRSGASTEFISEALGHTNVRTTQNYLAGFEDESKKDVVKALTAFKSQQPE